MELPNINHCTSSFVFIQWLFSFQTYYCLGHGFAHRVKRGLSHKTGGLVVFRTTQVNRIRKLQVVHPYRSMRLPNINHHCTVYHSVSEYNDRLYIII